MRHRASSHPAGGSNLTHTHARNTKAGKIGGTRRNYETTIKKISQSRAEFSDISQEQSRTDPAAEDLQAGSLPLCLSHPPLSYHLLPQLVPSSQPHQVAQHEDHRCYSFGDGSGHAGVPRAPGPSDDPRCSEHARKHISRANGDGIDVGRGGELGTERPPSNIAPPRSLAGTIWYQLVMDWLGPAAVLACVGYGEVKVPTATVLEASRDAGSGYIGVCLVPFHRPKDRETGLHLPEVDYKRSWDMSPWNSL